MASTIPIRLTAAPAVSVVAATLLALIASLPASASAQATERARTVIGSEGIESRNNPVRLGEGALVQGPILARNGSVTIGARSEVRSVSSRNGRISIGAGSIVAGPVQTRNGRIDLGDEVRVGGFVETRNGGVRLGARGHVSGDVETRNGGITLETDSWVEGSVTSRNGQVRLEGARVSRGIDVRGGDLRLMGSSRVDGDVVLLMGEDRGFSWIPFLRTRGRDPVVRIGPDVRIGGRLIVDERARLQIDPDADVPEPERYPSREAWPGR